MYLSNKKLPSYLHSRRLLNDREIIDGGYSVLAKPHRNRNFKVIKHNGDGYFLKQVSNTDAYSLSFLKREAACYTLTQHADLTDLQSIMPTLVDYDPQRFVLTQSLLADAKNLSDWLRTENTFDPQLGTELGRQLAKCHDTQAWSLASRNDVHVFPRQVPWALTLFEPGGNPFSEMTANTQAIFSMLQAKPAQIKALRNLRHEWRYSSLMHGDMKWDNIVVEKDDPSNPIFVDWELVDIGDPAWDIAGLLQNYVFATVLSQPEMIDTEYQSTGFPKAFSIQACHEQIRAFWQSYCDHNSRLENTHRDAIKQRAVQYAGARLIQTALEFFPSATQLPKPIPSLIKASDDLLNHWQKSMPLYFGL